MTGRARLLLLVALPCAGCSFATTVRQNTAAIVKSTETIGTNTEAIEASTSGTSSLVPALQDVVQLRGPMQAVATLGEPMQRVAALGEPMSRVAGLDPLPALTIEAA